LVSVSMLVVMFILYRIIRRRRVGYRELSPERLERLDRLEVDGGKCYDD
jgi:hypothetical protein